MLIHLFKDKELLKRCAYTIAMLLICMAMAVIPVYGVNQDALSYLFSEASVLGFMDTVSGGALSTMSLGAYGVTSYIMASIVIQMLAIAIPALERAREQGESGNKVIEKATVLLSIGITVFCSVMACMSNTSILIGDGPRYAVAAVASWVGGSLLIIFLAKKNDEYGIGNGISLVLMCNILSRLLPSLKSLYENDISGKAQAVMAKDITLVLIALFCAYLITVYLQAGVLKVRIKNTRKASSGYSSDGVLPMGVNIANVMPVVFASTVISIPSIIAFFVGADTDGKILRIFQQGYWWDKDNLYCMSGFAIYVALLILMGFYYSGIAYNSAEVADRMKKNGDVVPGVNPGLETEAYIERRRRLLTWVCIAFLLVLTITPDMVCAIKGITTVSFLGTSLIIVISVLFDTAARVKAACLHDNPKYGLYRKF